MEKTEGNPGRASVAYLKKISKCKTMGQGLQPHLENIGNSSFAPIWPCYVVSL